MKIWFTVCGALNVISTRSSYLRISSYNQKIHGHTHFGLNLIGSAVCDLSTAAAAAATTATTTTTTTTTTTITTTTIATTNNNNNVEAT
jgi:hypothetical protein